MFSDVYDRETHDRLAKAAFDWCEAVAQTNLKVNDTGLDAMLTKAGVTDVFCCGLVTDICVKSTALRRMTN